MTRRPNPLGAEPDLLETEVSGFVQGWAAKDQRLFAELLEDAHSPLQRELILRAAAARHSPAEIHAFGDRIRGMEDEAIFDACTVSARVDIPVTSRLRAEADPIHAFTLNGHPLSPRLEDDPGPAYPVVGQGGTRARFRPPPALFPPEPPPVYAPQKPRFEEESSSARGRPLPASFELGASGESPSWKREGKAPPSLRGINEAVKAMGISYRDHPVDGGELTLEQGLEQVAKALEKGIPVPATLGKGPKDRGRQVLILQVQPAGRSRAFQLHDPFTQETVWANQKDLLAGVELPFAAKTWRRITALALPLGAPR